MWSFELFKNLISYNKSASSSVPTMNETVHILHYEFLLTIEKVEMVKLAYLYLFPLLQPP